MKAKELMIGDWVRITDDDTDQHFDARITGVSGLGNIYAPLPKGEHAYPFSEDCAEPIPITAEILERNGFKKRENDIYHIGPRYVLAGGREDSLVIVTPEDPPVHGVKYLTEIHTHCIGKSGVNTLHNCDIEYVHQLQHALRICGIEKEIQL